MSGVGLIMNRKYALAAVGALAVCLMFAVLRTPFENVSPHDTGSQGHSTAGSADSIVQVPIAERVPVEFDSASVVTWNVHDDMGRPILAARLSTHSGAWLSGSDGVGQAIVESDRPVAYRIEAAEHESLGGVLKRGEKASIVLRRIGSIIANVVDDVGGPVAGVEVWLSTRPSDESALHMEATPRGTSDDSGVLRIDGVPFGDYLIHARHPLFVHSARRLKQMGWRPSLTVDKACSNTTVHMSMPFVCACEVGGGMLGADVISDSFQLVGGGYHSPSNRDGANACDAIKKKILSRFPNARVLVLVRDYANPGAQQAEVSVLATIWAAGYEPWQGSIVPVSYVDFMSPMTVDGAHTSEQFGGLVLEPKKMGGLPPQSLTFTVDSNEPGRAPQIRGVKITPKSLVTLPVGSYKISCNGYLESKDAGLNRESVAVKAGEITNVDLATEFKWSRCRFEWTCSQGPVVGGMMQLTHKASGASATLLISHFDVPVVVWVPEGVIEVAALGKRSADPSVDWKYSGTEVVPFGGTDASPCVIRNNLVDVKR